MKYRFGFNDSVLRSNIYAIPNLLGSLILPFMGYLLDKKGKRGCCFIIILRFMEYNFKYLVIINSFGLVLSSLWLYRIMLDYVMANYNEWNRICSFHCNFMAISRFGRKKKYDGNCIW